MCIRDSHNPLCCFSTSVYCYLFHYWLSPETFGYILAYKMPMASAVSLESWLAFFLGLILSK